MNTFVLSLRLTQVGELSACAPWPQAATASGYGAHVAVVRTDLTHSSDDEGAPLDDRPALEGAPRLTDEQQNELWQNPGLLGAYTGRHDIVQGTGLEEESTSGITAAALRRVMDVKRGWVNDIALNRGAVLLQVMTAFSVVLLGSVAIQPA